MKVKTKKVAVINLRPINFRRPVFFHGLGEYINSRRRGDNIQIKAEKWKWYTEEPIVIESLRRLPIQSACIAGIQNNYRQMNRCIWDRRFSGDGMQSWHAVLFYFITTQQERLFVQGP